MTAEELNTAPTSLADRRAEFRRGLLVSLGIYVAVSALFWLPRGGSWRAVLGCFIAPPLELFRRPQYDLQWATILWSVSLALPVSLAVAWRYPRPALAALYRVIMAAYWFVSLLVIGQEV